MPPDQISRSPQQPRLRRWLATGFWFFLLKGLAWLLAPALLLWCGAR